MLHCIGYACADGGCHPCSEKGPTAVKELWKNKNNTKWLEHITPQKSLPKTARITDCCTQLAQEIKKLRQRDDFFCVVGGDHSSAIGTWSGAKAAKDESLSLIWIDAHMDAHTFDSSHSKNIHGMPVASLLGYGDSGLANILSKKAKLQPTDLHLVGIRSFEKEEKKLLEATNANIYYAEDVLKKGFINTLEDICSSVTKSTKNFGISLDLDAFDPQFAPGVSTPARAGLDPKNLYTFLKKIKTLYKQQFIGMEIVEYNPCKDKDNKTLNIIESILESIT
jgi:arginase